MPLRRPLAATSSRAKRQLRTPWLAMNAAETSNANCSAAEQMSESGKSHWAPLRTASVIGTCFWWVMSPQCWTVIGHASGWMANIRQDLDIVCDDEMLSDSATGNHG